MNSFATILSSRQVIQQEGVTDRPLPSVTQDFASTVDLLNILGVLVTVFFEEFDDGQVLFETKHNWGC